MKGAEDRLRLRPVLAEDETSVRAAHRAMAREGFVFALGLDDSPDFGEYVRRLRQWRLGRELPEGWVPSTFLLAEVGGEVVGRLSIRHALNEFLVREGGHIGYAVLPDFRRRGHATQMLRLAIGLAREVGVDTVLVTCDVENPASAAVIERCGGALDSVARCEGGGSVRRYLFGPAERLGDPTCDPSRSRELSRERVDRDI